MKRSLWAIFLMLPLATGAALVAGPAASALEQVAHDQKAGANVLIWSQQQRDANFRRMDELFPSRRVAAGEHVHPLPPGESLLAALGGEEVVDQMMDSMNEVGLLVLQDGKIRLERYRRGFGPKQRWASFSMAKSVTSTLVGAAIRDGHIRSIDDPVTRYIPELAGSAYEGVNIRHLLTMTSGVEWNEDYTDQNSDVARMFSAPAFAGQNPTVAYMRHLSREVPPGTKWVYKTGESNLLGVLVENATGKRLADYLSQEIWKPYGMEKDAGWQIDSSGANLGGCCMTATLRDYGRFGQFVLDGGRAAGKEVLPSWWLAEATSKQVDIGDPTYGYGYQWWTAPGGFAAIGIFGQMISIDPVNRIVIVMLSNWPEATGRDLRTRRAALIERIEKAALNS